MARTLGDRDAKIFHQLAHQCRSYRGQLPTSAPASEFGQRCAVFLARLRDNSLDPSALPVCRLLTLHARLSLAQDTLDKCSAPQYPLVSLLRLSALSLRSDFGPSPCRAYQTSPDQLGAPPERYALFNKSVILLPGLRLAAAKLGEDAVAVLPI